jgi:transcriptional regulator with XRE-family HTH domain
MQPGQTFYESDLTSLAREAWEGSGQTQSALADALGVSQPALAQALNDEKRSLSQLRIRVIEHCTGLKVKGPEYQLVAGADDA